MSDIDFSGKTNIKDTIEYLKATDTKTYTTKDLGAIKISNCKKGLCEIKNYKTKIKDFVPLD